MTEDTQAKALARLKRASTAFTRGTERHERERQELAEAIAEAFHAGLRPSEIEAIAPYDRNHIGRIRKAAGIPPTREATVVSKRERDRQAFRSWWGKLTADDRKVFLASRDHLTKKIADRAVATGAEVGFGWWGFDGQEPSTYWWTPAMREFLNQIAEGER